MRCLPRWLFLGASLATASSVFCAPPGPPAYLDATQPLEARVSDLVARLTLEEKAELMRNGSPGVPRLGIPKYDWWNEALHGVARAGQATVFPQAIGLAAMWDDTFLQQVAGTIGIEARAKFHDAVRQGKGGERYYGLTFWSPNINIFRDPRWGRGQETYGEDPFLTAHLGVAFVRGLQGDDPRYLQAAACAKHFAVHSGPERLRHHFNVEPDAADFYETYLPAFEALVREAQVEAVMTAYNSVYGQPCSINDRLYDLLYNRWHFDGHVVSDCGSIADLYRSYHLADDDAGAEARAVKAGICVRCGDEPPALAEAVRRNLIPEAEVDHRLHRLLRTMFRLGFFDAPEQVRYAQIPLTENDSAAHRALALAAARRAIVLLKNDRTLPLRADTLHRLAVIGPNADSVEALVGNYNGTPAAPVTVLAGLRAALGDRIAVDYAKGCEHVTQSVARATLPPAPERTGEPDRVTRPESAPAADAGFADALAKARAADAIVFVGGLTAQLEGEEMPLDCEGFSGGDRTLIELPAVQEHLLEALRATGKPLVLVLLSGSALAIPWADAHVNAVVQAWYPGQAGGTAVAEVLLGRVNPAGRLPVTFYRATGDLPPFEDYHMAHRTYRYFTGRPLYAFGHGLSYTTFRYAHLRASPTGPGGTAPLHVSVEVTNTGAREGDEVVQLYAQEPAGTAPRAQQSLCGFRRLHLDRGETQTVTLTVPASALRRWSGAKEDYAIPPGEWRILAGASSADIRQAATVELSP